MDKLMATWGARLMGLNVRSVLLFCFIAMCLTTSLAAWPRAADLPGLIYFSADAVIDASGNATVSNIKGVKGVLAEVLTGQLQSRPFRPARLNGMPVTSTTRISAAAMIEPVNGSDVDVLIVDIQTGPWLRRVMPPSYPADMARHGLGGSAVVSFVIDADGIPRDVRFLEASDLRIENAVVRTLDRWRFNPEIIAGRPSTERVAVPIWFFPENKRTPEPVFACPPVGGRPHADGNSSGCLDRIEVTYYQGP